MSETPRDVLLVNYHRDAKFHLEGRSNKTVVISTHSDGRGADGVRARNIYIAPDANHGKSYEAIFSKLKTDQTGTCELLEEFFVDEA